MSFAEQVALHHLFAPDSSSCIPFAVVVLSSVRVLFGDPIWPAMSQQPSVIGSTGLLLILGLLVSVEAC